MYGQYHICYRDKAFTENDTSIGERGMIKTKATSVVHALDKEEKSLVNKEVLSVIRMS